MSKVVLRLEGAPDHADPSSAAKYQAERLGREGGDTFLTELLPLPALNLNHWPYEALFPDRTAYMAEVLSERLQRLRALFDSHRPAFVVCYGKGYWDYYKRLWPDATFTPSDGGWMQLARVSGSRIALVPFFGYHRMSNARVEALSAALVAAQ